MPRFMDVHHGMQGVTPEQLAEAHQADLDHQDAHGAKFLRYWYDAKEGTVFCLCEAPSKEAAAAVHREAGHPADEIYEVKEGH